MPVQSRIDTLFKMLDDVPASYRLPERIEQTEYLIDGTLHHWNHEAQQVESPICLKDTGSPRQRNIGSYPLLTAKQAMMALDAATRAYDRGRGLWPTSSITQRIRHIDEFTYRMKQKRDEIINLIMWEIGKTLPDATKEFDRTIDYIMDTIDALKDLDRAGSRFVIEQGIIGQIRRAPLGVVLCMGPYNYPLNETFATLIPALIMGNTVILKPPKLGVLLYRPLLEAFAESFPPGVINTVYGEGKEVLTPLMTSGRIDVLAFIGSSHVADILKKHHPKPHRLRSVLGLEAKNAGIIMDHADLDLAAQECVLGSLSYNGQRCTALKILWVHDKVIDRFLEKYCENLSRWHPGLPWVKDTRLTPLPEPGKPAALTAYVQDAQSCGAQIINESGGSVHHTYFHPAVLYPIQEKARLYREEQFGPVVPIRSFKDIEEPIQYVVDSNYGQQVSLFGTDPGTLARLIDPLVHQVCRVNLNSQCQRGPDTFPFTGRKDSAEGTLSVSDALRIFTIRTLVAAKDNPLNKEILSTIVRTRNSSFLSTDFIL